MSSGTESSLLGRRMLHATRSRYRDARQISTHVAELIGTFRQKNGFVFNQVHNIMGNVPPENVVAMLDTAYENSFAGSGMRTPCG